MSLKQIVFKLILFITNNERVFSVLLYHQDYPSAVLLPYCTIRATPELLYYTTVPSGLTSAAILPYCTIRATQVLLYYPTVPSGLPHCCYTTLLYHQGYASAAILTYCTIRATPVLI